MNNNFILKKIEGKLDAIDLFEDTDKSQELLQLCSDIKSILSMGVKDRRALLDLERKASEVYDSYCSLKETRKFVRVVSRLNVIQALKFRQGTKEAILKRICSDPLSIAMTQLEIILNELVKEGKY